MRAPHSAASIRTSGRGGVRARPWVPGCRASCGTASPARPAPQREEPAPRRARHPRILAFDLGEDLLAQPVFIVAGGEAVRSGTRPNFRARALGPKKLVVVEGGAYVDFYDVPKYVDQAVTDAALPSARTSPRRSEIGGYLFQKFRNR